MNIRFYGAAGCVTGSCHILEVKGKKILLDCGLFQGKDEKERGNDKFVFLPKEIDFVILSHAHIDHSGRIPLLYKLGFRGKVISTMGTFDLCKVMLPDSGHIMEFEVEWKNRKRIRQGLKEIDPLYTSEIATNSLRLFKPYPYNELIELFEGLKIKFIDAGHLLGSAFTEIYIKEDEKDIKIVYSGDIGNKNIPIIREPEIIEETDYLIMETTYGDRLHTNIESELKELVSIIKETFKKGGNVIIPSFAVGRTQEVIYALNRYIEAEELKDIRVFVDSPLAMESTKVFEKYKEYYDEDAKKILDKGIDPLEFRGLTFTHSPEESMALNKIQSGAIIISASGMCEAGRIRHHLKHNLWRKESAIVFVGYQAEGTLGRSLLDGVKKVKLFGEEVAVNASLYNLHGLSGHADREGLMEWVKGFKIKPKEILLVHSDKEVQESFKKLLDSNGYNSKIMKLDDIFTEAGIDSVSSTPQIKTTHENLKKDINELLNELDDIENLDKNELLNKIKEVIYRKK